MKKVENVNFMPLKFQQKLIFLTIQALFPPTPHNPLKNPYYISVIFKSIILALQKHCF